MAASAMLTLGSCADDPSVNAESASGSLEYGIVLSTGTLRSRATTYEAENDQENKISRYTIFFYNSSDQSKPVYAIDNTLDTPVTEGEYMVKVPLSVDVVEKLFGSSGTTCTAFAIVNLPDANLVDITKLTVDNASASVPNLNAVKMKADFGADGTPDKFVMKGMSTTLAKSVDTDGTVKVTGRIDLKRVAAKIRIFVYVPEQVYVISENIALKENDITILKQEWGRSPNQYDSFDEWFVREKAGQICYRDTEDPYRAFIYNGVNAARIDGNPLSKDVTDETTLADARWFVDTDYFEVNHNKTLDKFILKENLEITDRWENYPYTHSTPFYSYPNMWTQSHDEERQTYLKVLVSWRIVDEKNFATYTSNPTDVEVTPNYYQIPINSNLTNSNPNTLESNKYYRIGMNVGMMGSKSVGDPQIIDDCQWEVIDWEDVPVNMSLQEARYLVFNQKEFVMNNTEEISIPFTTSHQTEVKSVTITYYDYSEDSTDGQIPSYQITLEDNKLTDNAIFSIDETQLSNGMLHFTHFLKVWEKGTGDIYELKEDDTPYSRFDIEITVKHKNYPLEETVTITQYPAIYIENEFVGLSNSADNNGGFVFVNNYYGSPVTESAAQEATGSKLNNKPVWMSFQMTGNLNPNMYIISVTQLSANESEYQIGDPRTLNYNNDLGNPDSEVAKDANDNDKDGYSLPDRQVEDPWVRSTYNTYRSNGELKNFASQGCDPMVAPRLYGNSTTGTISYYYPSDESNGVGSKAHMIAPKIRIASGNAAGSTMSRVRARRRCASYQEAGYPAGRWRLPTQAEVAFIAGLSGKGKIPLLFINLNPNSTSPYGYWTAQGAFAIAPNDLNYKGVDYKSGDLVPVWDEKDVETNPGHYVRCVYDEWYWVKQDGQPDRLGSWNIFTWGDRRKDNTQAGN